MRRRREEIRVMAAAAVRFAQVIEDLDRLEDQVRRTAQQVNGTLSDVRRELGEVMAGAGTRRIRSGNWNIVPHREEKVVIDDPDLVPEDCVLVETETSRNARWGRIRRRLIAGNEVPGARLVLLPVTVRMLRTKKGA